MEAYNNKKKRRKKKSGSTKSAPNSRTRTPRVRSGLLGRLQDFWYSYGDLIQTILKIACSIIAILLMVGLYMGWFDTSKEELQSEKGKLNVKYEIISTVETPSIEVQKNTGLTLEILFKNPTVSYDEVKQTLDYLYAKNKVSLDEKGKRLVAMEAKIYNRKIILDKGYLPKGTYYYGLKDGFSTTLNTKRPKEKDYKVDMKYDEVTQAESEEETDELTGEVINKQTIDPVLKGNTYRKFLLLMEYATLFNDDYEKAATFYVGYDLRINPNSEEGTQQITDTQEFIERYLANGEQSILVENTQDFWLSYKQTNNKKYQILRNYMLTDDFDAAMKNYR